MASISEIKFRIEFHGVSGTWYPHAAGEVDTIEQAAEVCRQLKEQGYGIQCFHGARREARRVWHAPWGDPFDPDMAQSRAWLGLPPITAEKQETQV